MIALDSTRLFVFVNAIVALEVLLTGIALSLQCSRYLRTASWPWIDRRRAPERTLGSKKPVPMRMQSAPTVKGKTRHDPQTAAVEPAKINAAAIVLIAYLSAIGMAELVAVRISVAAGLFFEAGIILVLLGQFVITESAPYRSILPVLALAPLLRILSYTLPINQIPRIYWYAMIGTPFLLAMALTARFLGFSRANIGLGWSSQRSQLLIAVSGLPLSIVAYMLLRPAAGDFRWTDEVLGVVILIVFVGFAEEVFFRGILLRAANEHLGRLGLLFSSVLFAIMYFGSLSWSYVLFMGLIGLYLGWCVNRTGSIWGAVLAHSALSVGTILVWPFVWR